MSTGVWPASSITRRTVGAAAAARPRPPRGLTSRCTSAIAPVLAPSGRARPGVAYRPRKPPPSATMVWPVM